MCVCVLFTWSNEHFGGGSVPVNWPEGVYVVSAWGAKER